MLTKPAFTATRELQFNHAKRVKWTSNKQYSLQKGIFDQARTFHILKCKRASPAPPTPTLILYIYLPVKHTALFQAPEQLGFEELADCDVLRKTLSSPRLQDEVSGECLGGCGLEGSQLNFLVEWVAGNDGPAIEDER